MNHQQRILKLLYGNGAMKKSDIVNQCGINYHCNAGFYIGEILYRMVKNGTVKKVKHGVYAFNSPFVKRKVKNDVKSVPLFEDHNSFD